MRIIGSFGSGGRLRVGRRYVGAAGVVAVLGLAIVPASDAAVGPPSFAPSVIAGSTEIRPDAVAIGDLNGDGRLDLATSNHVSNSVSVLLKDAIGNGYTASSTGSITGNSPQSVVIGDLNGDGRPDLATADRASDTVSVMTKDAVGAGYSLSATVATGGGPYALVIGDLNGDGRPDLATADHADDTVSVLTKDAVGSGYTRTIAGTTDAHPMSLVIGDLNDDGRPDLATANTIARTVSVFTKDAVGDGYTVSPTAPVSDSPRSLAVGDLNGDGRLDLATTTPGSGIVSVWIKDAVGDGFTTTAVGFTADAPWSVAIGDLNGDGRPDLATANFVSDTVSVLTKDAVGDGYTTSTAGTTGSAPVSVAIGDLDGDGRPDLATANSVANSVSVLTNTSVFPVRLSVSVVGDGAGTVRSAPAGISCTSGSAIGCSSSFDPGTNVTLTAVPASGSTFAGFSGAGCSGSDPCVVSVDQARSVTASFAKTPVPVPGTGEGPPSNVPAPVVPGAPTRFASPEAAETLKCRKDPVQLADVYGAGGRTLVQGGAEKQLVGKVAVIYLADGRRRVGTAKVGKNGLFSAKVALPPKRIRSSNRARYYAVVGGHRTRALKFTRRMATTSISSRGRRVTFRGRVLGPLMARQERIVIKQRMGCKAYRTVARVTPDAEGRFSVMLRAPAGVEAVAYRAQTHVVERRGSGKRFVTYTLPRVVRIR